MNFLDNIPLFRLTPIRKSSSDKVKKKDEPHCLLTGLKYRRITHPKRGHKITPT
jgi:hypothetical protein